MIKILFIINPISGTGRQRSIIDKIETYIDKNKFDYSIVFSEYAHHATKLASLAVENGFDVVIAAGGDGSINDIVNALIGTKVALGVIPIGSGNGFARFMKISSNIEKAIKIINNYKTSFIDTIKITSGDFEKVYVSIAGIGFDALVAQKFDKSKNRGFKSYMEIIVSDYPNYKASEYKLIFDNKREIKTKALMLSFANSNQFGFNAAIAPDASITDGYIDISVTKKVPLMILPIVSQMLWVNNVYQSSYVKNYKAKTVKVYSADGCINIDGESYEVGNEIFFENDKLSLKVIVP